jgi:hypothetical protein
VSSTAFAQNGYRSIPHEVKLHKLQTELPGAHGKVQTSSALLVKSGEWISPEAIPAGEPITLVCGFINGGSTRVNVTSLSGLATDQYNFMQSLFEINAVEVGYEADPAKGTSELSMQLSFTVPTSFKVQDPSFSGFPYTLRIAGVVFYNERSSRYSTTFFNETVMIVAPRNSQIDTPSLLPYILGPIAVFAFLYMIMDAVPQLGEIRGALKDSISISANTGSAAKLSSDESSKSSSDSSDDIPFSILTGKKAKTN